ncbi:WD-40 repeat protein [Gloeothece citriformis PCC 7424]|uniref:WD-40 repeat protein n=1 Tax=Gloeothece citriformis (strain PCC 7424) TaxID=65393 RepID=B7KCP0_GLOC7|nr:hypothetical protein [Gloeothece citriformis]ACK71591.1 WD-40 repeat protein [Gloeothece citriformis PCC 7424]
MFGLRTTYKKLFVHQWSAQLKEYVTELVWSKEGYLAACSAAGEVILLKPNQKESVEILSPSTPLEQSIDCLEFSADGKYLAAGGQDGKLRIWQVKPELELIETLDTQNKWITCLHWHPKLNQVAFTLGRYVQIWDVITKEIVISLPFESSSVLDLAWHPQGDYLAIAGDREVKVWSCSAWNDDPEMLDLPAACLGVSWSPNGEYLAASSLDLSVFVWQWGNLSPWRMQGFGGKVRNLSWSTPTVGTAPLLAVSSVDGIVIWQKQAEDEQGWTPKGLRLHEGVIQGLKFQPKSLLLASVAEDGWLILWQKAKKPVQWLEGVSEGFSGLAWHPNGNYLAAAGQNGELLVWVASESGKGFG